MANKNEIIQVTTQTPAIVSPSAPKGMINMGSGVQVGTNAGTMNLAINCPTPKLIQGLMSIFAPKPISQKVSHAIEWASLSTEQYCLFVLENEDYNCGAFSIAKKCALEKYTHPNHKQRFKPLLPEAVTELMRMPCIFAKRNRHYNHTDDSHPALLGRITSIYDQRDTIKLCFSGFQAFQQQLLNQNITLLGLAYSSLRNELDEEHWSIKDGNLPSVMAQLNVTVE